MKPVHLIIAGVAAFLIGFVAQAPAAIVYGWFAPKDTKLVAYGFQGSVLHGSVAGVGMQGKTAWQDLQWTLRPLHLLTGRLVADVQTTAPATIRARLSKAPWGTSLSDVHASGSLQTVLALIEQFLPLEGQVRADLDSLRLRDGKLSSAKGTITMDGVASVLARDPVPLGNFQATVTTESDQVSVKLESLAGPLEVNGTTTLAPDQSYTVDLTLKVKPGSPPEVENLVRSMRGLGVPDAQGVRHLQRSGKLA